MLRSVKINRDLCLQYIHFSIGTNTFSKLDKYIWRRGENWDYHAKGLLEEHCDSREKREEARPLSVPFLLRTSGISQSSWLDYLGGCISQYLNPSSQECTDTLHPFSWQCIVYKTIQGLILGCLGIRHIVSSIQYRSPSLWCVWPQPWHRLWNVIWATLNRKRLNGAFSSRSTRVLT